MSLPAVAFPPLLLAWETVRWLPDKGRARGGRIARVALRDTKQGSAPSPCPPVALRTACPGGWCAPWRRVHGAAHRGACMVLLRLREEAGGGLCGGQRPVAALRARIVPQSVFEQHRASLRCGISAVGLSSG
jgi:hypothetical protein